MGHQHQVTGLEPVIVKGQVVDIVENGLNSLLAHFSATKILYLGTNTLGLVVCIDILAVLLDDLLGILHVGRLRLVAVVDVLDDQQVHLADLLLVRAFLCPCNTFLCDFKLYSKIF